MKFQLADQNEQLNQMRDAIAEMVQDEGFIQELAETVLQGQDETVLALIQAYLMQELGLKREDIPLGRMIPAIFVAEGFYMGLRTAVAAGTALTEDSSHRLDA